MLGKRVRYVSVKKSKQKALACSVKAASVQLTPRSLVGCEGKRGTLNEVWSKISASSISSINAF